MTEPALPAPTDASGSEELERMSLLEHLEELRKRLIRTFIVLGVGFALCWVFREYIYQWMVDPIEPYLPPGPNGEPGKLAFFSITTPFFFYLKITFIASIFLTSPWWISEIWGFVAPGLYRREKLYAIPFVFFGTLFFLGGGAFGYYIAFEYSVEFLLGLGSQFEAVLDVDRYFRFLVTILLGLGAMFQMPIMIFMLAQIGVVTPRFLMRHFRWAVMIIFVAAAIITPTPDWFNLCLFAVPGIVLYLVGVGAAWLALRGRGKEA